MPSLTKIFFAALVLSFAAQAQTPVATPTPVPAPAAAPAPAPTASLNSFCEEIEALYRRNGWGRSGCETIAFEVMGVSSLGKPLVMFRSEGAPVAPLVKTAGNRSTASTKLTVIQCGIHGDELAALPMCMNLIHEIVDGKRKLRAGTRLIIQPLLNPDGMLVRKPTRNNAHGVDINRNFPTKDWERDAIKSWSARDHKDARNFPGDRPNSEPETQAIVKFLQGERPQKIVSIHAPLGFLDLDAKAKSADRERRAHFLAINIVKNSGNYKFRKFGVYPGSLGNYAGREQQVPVYTLELPSANSNRPTIDNYWKKFRVGLWRAIDFDLDTGQFTDED